MYGLDETLETTKMIHLYCSKQTKRNYRSGRKAFLNFRVFFIHLCLLRVMSYVSVQKISALTVRIRSNSSMLLSGFN